MNGRKTIFGAASAIDTSDGTSAHTTPVYVVRDGLRFWKFDGLDELFEKRMTSLAQIEEIVASAKQLDAEGKLEWDRYRKQLALQGDLLLERVTQARNMYDDLKRAAVAEQYRFYSFGDAMLILPGVSLL